MWYLTCVYAIMLTHSLVQLCLFSHSLIHSLANSLTPLCYGISPKMLTHSWMQLRLLTHWLTDPLVRFLLMWYLTCVCARMLSHSWVQLRLLAHSLNPWLDFCWSGISLVCVLECSYIHGCNFVCSLARSHARSLTHLPTHSLVRL